MSVSYSNESKVPEQIKLPYLTYPKKTEQYFSRIKEVEVPEKVTYDFLENVMLFKGNNDRYLISLLKKLGFLEPNGVPTDMYREYRNEVESKKILGKCIRLAYHELFRRNKNLHELTEEQIEGYVKSATGLGKESSTLGLITKTLVNLIEIADFSEDLKDDEEKNNEEIEKETEKEVSIINDKLNLNYTISINLPEITNEEVYEKIFNSIKKTLLTK